MDRILIADDEYQIRKGLRAILERSGIQYSEICECEDGLQALRQMTENKFDLVFMDIRMPEMDGLDAIQEALLLESPPCFIILSGCDDFAFARRAIRFGVHDYLLKPVDMNELLAAVRKADDYIKVSKRNSEKLEVYERLADSVFENELNYILLNINLRDDDVREIVGSLRAHYLEAAYRMMSFEQIPGKLSSAGEQEAMKEAVVEAAAELGAFAVCTDYEKKVLVIVPEALDLRKTREVFNRRFGEDYILGISAPATGTAEIRQCYRQAAECKKHRMIARHDHVILWDSGIAGPKPYHLPIDQIKKIQALVGTPQSNNIEPLLGDVFATEKIAQYGVDYLEKCSEAIATFIVDYYRRLLPQSFSEESYGAIRNVYDSRDLNDYLNKLRDYLFSLDGYLKTLKTQYKGNNKMEEVLGWLNENYTNPNLSMSMAANQVSLNYTYFSMAFHEYKNMSFVSYLRKLRVQKAQELIALQKYKMNRVAYMVGFQNPRLFTKAFREVTGVTPAVFGSKTAVLASKPERM